MTPVGILLAAGRGRRFDPQGVRNKLLQPLAEGEPVVAASARHLRAVLPRVVAVMRPGEAALAGVLREAGCELTVCDGADAGMAASLVHAIAHAAPAPGWVIALGDMPFVAPSTVAALAQALADGALIAAPFHHGRRGNPVAIAAALRPQLLALEGDQGARALLAQYPVTAVAVDDPGVLRDIDTPADL